MCFSLTFNEMPTSTTISYLITCIYRGTLALILSGIPAYLPYTGNGTLNDIPLDSANYHSFIALSGRSNNMI